MDKYFIIVTGNYGQFSQIIESNTKEKCEKELVKQENLGYKIYKIIKGVELDAIPRKVVKEYELQEKNTHLVLS